MEGKLERDMPVGRGSKRKNKQGIADGPTLATNWLLNSSLSPNERTTARLAILPPLPSQIFSGL